MALKRAGFFKGSPLYFSLRLIKLRDSFKPFNSNIQKHNLANCKRDKSYSKEMSGKTWGNDSRVCKIAIGTTTKCACVLNKYKYRHTRYVKYRRRSRMSRSRFFNVKRESHTTSSCKGKCMVTMVTFNIVQHSAVQNLVMVSIWVAVEILFYYF